tara:strand:- start:5892 stop:6020 length:129 start_codon:yes stop_codon:yes gene_type:complete
MFNWLDKPIPFQQYPRAMKTTHAIFDCLKPVASKRAGKTARV